MVFDIVLDEEPTKIAFLTDEVDNVIEAKLDEIEPIAGLGVRWPTECLRGSIKSDDKLILLLDGSFEFLDQIQNETVQ